MIILTRAGDCSSGEKARTQYFLNQPTKETICRAAETQQTFSGVASLRSWAEETGELTEDDLLISASVDEGGEFYSSM